MFEAVVKFLIVLVITAFVVLLIIFVLGVIGFAIPAQFIPLLWVLALLLLILYAWRLFAPHVKAWWG